MAIIIIDNNSSQAKKLIEYLKTLPFATVIEENETSLHEPIELYNSIKVKPQNMVKKSFEEAAKECNAVPLNTFIQELHRQIDEHFDA